MARLRFFEAPRAESSLALAHTEFLRTGRLPRPQKQPMDRRPLSPGDIAEETARRLVAASEKTHERLNKFHPSIRFPKLIFHRTLKESPGLGYCHVTASRTRFQGSETVSWAFFIANFYADFDETEQLFTDIDVGPGRMYFALAIKPGAEAAGKLVINRDVRGNGVLFRTDDPQVAIRNVLLLGARNEQLRDIIRQL